jgi:hypothetical protein
MVWNQMNRRSWMWWWWRYPIKFIQELILVFGSKVIGVGIQDKETKAIGANVVW